MKKTIHFYPAFDSDTYRESREFDKTLPVSSVCPLCQTSTDPMCCHGVYHIHPKGEVEATVILHCTRCEYAFIESYAAKSDASDWQLIRVLPQQMPKCDFTASIQQLSPAFCKIYQQSIHAEKRGLNEICGLGYRKALEFLVKDYVIYKQPEQKEVIESEPLSRSIHRIEDPRIKTLAERTAWLGNDEAHYIRKHENYSVDDMKAFIEAVVYCISFDFSYENALSIHRK